MRTLLFALLAISQSAAGEVLLSFSRADESRVVFMNYVAPGQAYVQDLGVAPGGLDAGAEIGDDKAAVLLQRPNAYDARNARPVALGCGLAATAGRALKIEASLVLGSYVRSTDVAVVWWNGAPLAEFDSTHDRVDSTEGQSVKTFSCDVPGNLVNAENVLAFMPKGIHDAVLLVDAVRVSGDGSPSLLPRERTRALMGDTPVGETRALKGKGRALLIDRWRMGRGLLEYEVIAALQADYDAYPPPDRPSACWLSPSEWNRYKAVVLDTPRQLTPEEDAVILRYLEQGGLVILTPHTLNGFFSSNPRMKPQRGHWTAGFLGGWVKCPAPAELAVKVKGDAPLIPGAPKPSSLSWTETVREISPFRATSNADMREVRLAGRLAGQDQELPLLYVHPVGQGHVIGSVLPMDPRLGRMLRDILVAVMHK